MGERGLTAREKVLRHIVVSDSGCWLWQLSCDRDGYGRVTWQGRKSGAHRFSYEAFVAQIPAGLVIDHLCRVPGCVRPDHLRAVTDRVNILCGEGLPAVHAAKTHCIRGHEFTPANTITYVTKTGKENRGVGRGCRECSNALYRKRWAERGGRVGRGTKSGS